MGGQVLPPSTIPRRPLSGISDKLVRLGNVDRHDNRPNEFLCLRIRETLHPVSD